MQLRNTSSARRRTSTRWLPRAGVATMTALLLAAPMAAWADDPGASATIEIHKGSGGTGATGAASSPVVEGEAGSGAHRDAEGWRASTGMSVDLSADGSPDSTNEAGASWPCPLSDVSTTDVVVCTALDTLAR